VVVHGDLHLRDLISEPRHDCERAGHREAGPVGIAFVESEPGCLHRPAKYVQREHGRGQEQSAAVHALEFRDGHALAARNAHQVREQQVHRTHLRMLQEPGARLLVIRELRHVTPVV
jgi:hypothetical protein